MIDNKTIFWIESVLSNDEVSSDQELVQYFMEEGGLTQQEACLCVAKRDLYQKNIIISPAAIRWHAKMLVKHESDGRDKPTVDEDILAKQWGLVWTGIDEMVTEGTQEAFLKFFHRMVELRVIK